MHFSTKEWRNGSAGTKIENFVGGKCIEMTAYCSVVPAVNGCVERFLKSLCGRPVFKLNHTHCGELDINYPKPASIGTDRLASALAASHHYGWPVLSINFGTAATFDVVDDHRCFIGGAIAPGISVMNQYLHNQTEQLPLVRLNKTKCYIGKSTQQAIRTGTVLGYRGLVMDLVNGMRLESGYKKMPVIATGGYASLIAQITPCITEVYPSMALEGVRLALLCNDSK